MPLNVYQYYAKKLEECKSDMKSTWVILNEMINNKKGRVIYKRRLMLMTRNIRSNSDRGPFLFTLQKYKIKFSELNSTLSHFSPFFSFWIFCEFVVPKPSTEREIIEICTSFRAGTAAGYDHIAMNVIKETIDLIVQPLTYVTNLSFSSGTVPDQMKIARVVPLFKTGDLSLFTNYRPFSVLPALSKILERIVYKRLINFLNKFYILSNNQYGFRKNRSTPYALIQLYDKRSDAIDHGKITLGLFIDLSKAFHTVNHDILVAKLEFLLT